MPDTPFFRLLRVPIDDKGEALRDRIAALNAALSANSPLPPAGEGPGVRGALFPVDPAAFAQIPGSPFAYWVGDTIRQLFKTLPPVESEGRMVRLGDHPDNQNRYLRLFWEVPSLDRSETRKWIPYQKGGAYSPFYYDIHLVVDWDLERETYYGFYGRPGRSNEHPSNYQLFFRPGLTWPRRTQKGFNLRALPSGCVFADKGPAVFIPENDADTLLALLAVMNSLLFRFLLKLQMAFGSYEVGVIQRTPIPDLTLHASRFTFHASRFPLSRLAREAHDLQRARDTADETTHVFTGPALARHRAAPTLQEAGRRLAAEEQARQARLAASQAAIDDLVFDLYGLSESDRALVRREMEGSPSGSEETAAENDNLRALCVSVAETEPADEELAPPADLPTHVQNLLMWAVGVAFGRWDLRKTLDSTLLPPLPEPFAPLPRYAPAALDEAEPGYRPVSILVDDPGHADDLIARVEQVLRQLWGARADDLTAEACALLGVRTLRDYFRDPRRFFAFHLQRYSKSRRRAPLYWPLQSARHAYTIWLYYPRIRYDTLYAAGRDYADAKIRLEQARLDDLRQTAEGLTGSAAKRRAQEVERQRRVVEEVTAFRNTLDQVALLNIPSDPHDGVLISIAPLHELVPWKEAERMWEALVAGEYGWSVMAQQMRKKRLVKTGDGRRET